MMNKICASILVFLWFNPLCSSKEYFDDRYLGFYSAESRFLIQNGSDVGNNLTDTVQYNVTEDGKGVQNQTYNSSSQGNHNNHTDEEGVDDHEEEDHTNEEEDHDHEEEDHTNEEDGHDHEEENHDESHAEDEDEHSHSDSTSEVSEVLANGDRPWGPALLAAFLVNLVTFVGVFFMLPSNIIFKKVPKHVKEIMVKIIIPSFAAGTLLATSVFLLIPESLHLLNGGHDDHERRRLENSEVDATWKFGASLIGGYFLPYIFGGIIPHAKHADATACPPSIEVAEKENAAESRADIESEAKASTDTSHSNEKLEDEIKPQDLQLAISLTIGDAFHNFADGIMIGTAFLLCSQSIAITVTATTVLHELSQELSDFILLTTQCGLSIPKALLINFFSGSSVILGVIIILSTPVSNESIGVILAMSSGVYLFVTLTECAPRITASLFDNRRRFLSILFWIIGTIPIGLILLNHKHCE